MTKRKSLATALKQQQSQDKRVKHTNDRQESQPQKAGLNGKKNGKVQHIKPLIPFRSTDRILFVGEGNFSFSASCVENHLEHAENVVATSFDDETTLLQKYPDATQFLDTVRDCCGEVLHNVDATKLHTKFKCSEFDVCIFMFPHVAAGIADEARNILTNQQMLSAFFKSVQVVIKTQGTIAVTLAVSKTYDLWDIKRLAKSQGLVVKTSGVFNGADYPGYEHRRTQGHDKSVSGFAHGKGEERSARWIIFEKKANGPAKIPASRNAVVAGGKPSADTSDESD